MQLHPTQQKILDLAKSMPLNYKKPRAIGNIVGIKNPQNIKHHVEQLENKGLISIDKKTYLITVNGFENNISEKLFKLPIYGFANCGPASVVAEQNLEGFLAIPASKITRGNTDRIFIVIAEGDSLNAAKKIKGGPIETGDYVIIDGNNRSPENGQYVLSVIDGAANLKRFHRDGKTGQIKLESESTFETKPIYIQEDDFRDYMINGTIMGVIKNQNKK